jgi:hypothetical protein
VELHDQGPARWLARPVVPLATALDGASRDSYEENFLPNSLPFGSPDDCLDCACYFGDQPTGPNTPPRTFQVQHWGEICRMPASSCPDGVSIMRRCTADDREILHGSLAPHP